MSTLTPEQCRLARQSGESPLRLVDPDTNQQYVLVAADVYDRLQSVLTDPDLRDFYPRFATSYYGAVATWYEALALGRPGGEIVAAVQAATPAEVWTPALNPGHLIHLDEWLNSPIFRASRQELRSGMAIQVDVIP